MGLPGLLTQTYSTPVCSCLCSTPAVNEVWSSSLLRSMKEHRPVVVEVVGGCEDVSYSDTEI